LGPAGPGAASAGPLGLAGAEPPWRGGAGGGGTGSALAVVAGNVSVIAPAPLIAAIASLVQRFLGRVELPFHLVHEQNLPCYRRDASVEC